MVLIATVCLAVAGLPSAMAQTSDSGTAGTAGGSTLQTTGTMVADWIDSSGAAWVWPAQQQGQPNQYVQVIHDVTLASVGAADAKLVISADTNYAVWMNGEFAGFGQWSNFPDDKTYDVLDLSKYAQRGKNRLCIGVYYQGENSSTYRKGPGGILYALRAGDDTVAVSGESTRIRQSPDYVSGDMPKVTGQLSFTFEYRAYMDDGWRASRYQPDSSWRRPEPPELTPLSKRPVRPRPVAKLVLQDRAAMRIVAQGAFTRNQADATPAVAMQSDSLSHRSLDELLDTHRTQLSDTDTTGMALKPEAWSGMTGAYVVLDVGREEAGLLELELDAPEGTVLDIGFGEHLEDLRVRTRVGGRNFANRYVTAGGQQQFLHPFLRLAGRYIQLHITPPAGAEDQPIILQYAGLRPTPYPVEHRGVFASPDTLHNMIWEVSRRTLELCMHEHYEDCPWREQALYAMDARNQALAGYYCFGNYDFAAASIGLLGQGMNPRDGFLELCAPADVSITIPSFSLAWILMLDDYLLFSGDRELVELQLPVARQIIETCTRESTGPIITTPKGPRMWNFYEWAPGLDGNGVHGNVDLAEERLEAPLNLFYLLSLDAMARMTVETGGDATTYTQMADDLRSTFSATFWDAGERAFLTRVNDNQPPHYAELTQALAILAGVVPEIELEALRERLASDNNGLVPCTISHTLYKFEALLTDKARYAPRVFELIARDWGYMLGQGATSFWETIEGASAFGNAGSLCHGWSGIPAWFYGAHVLGVRPTAPGFADYETNPASTAFKQAGGSIPLPGGGSLQVQWHVDDGEIVQEVIPIRQELPATGQ